MRAKVLVDEGLVRSHGGFVMADAAERKVGRRAGLSRFVLGLEIRQRLPRELGYSISLECTNGGERTRLWK
jgi:hypothetical protein